MKGCPSPERVALYVREEMIDGATVADVMSGGGHKSRATTIVRWRVWARLRAEGYSYPGIASRFGVDHSTVSDGVRAAAEGRLPYRHCRDNRIPLSAPRRSHVRTRPKLIPCVGFDPTERLVAGKLNEAGE